MMISLFEAQVTPIPSMILCKMEVTQRRIETLSVAQLCVVRGPFRFDVVRLSGYDRPYPCVREPAFVTKEIVSDNLEMDSAYARVIVEENFAMQSGWRIYDRTPAQSNDGVETRARFYGIERLLVGRDHQHGFWRATPTRYDDWRGRAHLRKMELIQGQANTLRR